MIKKAVIPAAGLGTRFLPAAKAQPKEMLPIIDTPVIQYVVQEAVDAGINDILIITGKGKRAIEDHFDRNFELESRLENKGKSDVHSEIRRIGEMADIHFIRQKELNGLGDAISYARHHVGDEPFAVLLGDTIIDSATPSIKMLMDAYERYGGALIAVEKVPRNKVDRYGIVDSKKIDGAIRRVSSLIEKPSVEESPSNLAIAGRYILLPRIFKILEETPRGKNNEIQLTDALRVLLQESAIHSCTIDGRRFDIGNKLDYLKTQVEFGLKRDEFSEPFISYLKERIKDL